MKNFFPIFCLAVTCLFLSQSCKKKSTAITNNTSNNGLLTFKIPITKTETLTDSIPPFPFPFLNMGLIDTFATQVEQYLGTYAPGVTKDQIKKIVCLELDAIIDNSNTQTLDFIDDSVKLYVKAYGGADSTLVATKYGIQPGSKKIIFTCIPTDVKDYFNSPFMQTTLVFNTKPNQGMLANTVFLTNLTFEVTHEPKK